MIYTDLNNIPENLSGLTPNGIRVARYQEFFLTRYKAVLSKLFSSEYFGKDNDVKVSYYALNAVNNLLLSLLFMEEEIEEMLSRDEIVILSKLYEKYSISCIKKYLMCIAGIDAFDLINSFNSLLSNPDDEIIEIPDDLGISTMEINNTFIID